MRKSTKVYRTPPPIPAPHGKGIPTKRYRSQMLPIPRPGHRTSTAPVAVMEVTTPTRSPAQKVYAPIQVLSSPDGMMNSSPLTPGRDPLKTAPSKPCRTPQTPQLKDTAGVNKKGYRPTMKKRKNEVSVNGKAQDRVDLAFDVPAPKSPATAFMAQPVQEYLAPASEYEEQQLPATEQGCDRPCKEFERIREPTSQGTTGTLEVDDLSCKINTVTEELENEAVKMYTSDKGCYYWHEPTSTFRYQDPEYRQPVAQLWGTPVRGPWGALSDMKNVYAPLGSDDCTHIVGQVSQQPNEKALRWDNDPMWF